MSSCVTTCHFPICPLICEFTAKVDVRGGVVVALLSKFKPSIAHQHETALTSAEVRVRRGYPAALRSDGHQRSRQSSRRNAGLSVRCAVARRCTAPKLTESSDATSWVGLPNMALQLIARSRSPTPRSATCVGWSSER